jgi:hypothetical protein
MFRLLSFLAAFGILVLYESQADRALGRPSVDRVDAQMMPVDGTRRHAVEGPRAPYPAWLLLPPGARITNGVFFFDMTPTQGGGLFGFDVTGDGRAVIRAWETRLRAAGFTDQPIDPTRCTFGILSSLSMQQPATGRGLTLTLSSDGLELSFWEPYSGRP